MSSTTPEFSKPSLILIELESYGVLWEVVYYREDILRHDRGQELN